MALSKFRCRENLGGGLGALQGHMCFHVNNVHRDRVVVLSLQAWRGPASLAANSLAACNSGMCERNTTAAKQVSTRGCLQRGYVEQQQQQQQQLGFLCVCG